MIPVWIESLIIVYCLAISYSKHKFKSQTKLIALFAAMYAISITSSLFTVYDNHQNTAQLVIDFTLLCIIGKYAVSLPRNTLYDLMAFAALGAMTNNLLMLISYFITIPGYTVATIIFSDTLGFILSIVMFYALIRIAHNGGSRQNNSNWIHDFLSTVFSVGHEQKVSWQERAQNSKKGQEV